jgi:exonuclease III
MNVGHLDLDIHNPDAKHIKKQAGLTAQERKSFTDLLATGFIDAFRFFYPSKFFYPFVFPPSLHHCIIASLLIFYQKL